MYYNYSTKIQHILKIRQKPQKKFMNKKQAREKFPRA